METCVELPSIKPGEHQTSTKLEFLIVQRERLQEITHKENLESQGHAQRTNKLTLATDFFK